MQKFREVSRTFFLALSVVLICHFGTDATLVDWVVIVVSALLATTVAIVLFRALRITDEDIDAMWRLFDRYRLLKSHFDAEVLELTLRAYRGFGDD